jgi:hypothetical protein
MSDEAAGAEVYCSLRARWDRYVRTFAAHMVHNFEDIDPVGCDPDRVADRQEIRTRSRAGGG